MARPEKVAVVDEIRTKLAEADATVLTEYRGLTVHELADLRGSLRGTGTEYKVFKNTLARRAIEGAGYDEITSMFEGPVALAFVRGDAAAAAKALRDFANVNPALVVKGGLLGERVISPADINALADLPSREVMLTQIAGMFQAPLTKAAGPVPGVHPQLRLRRAGADQRARRRRRGPPRGRTEPEAGSRRRGARRRSRGRGAPSRRGRGPRSPCRRGRGRGRTESTESE